MHIRLCRLIVLVLALCTTLTYAMNPFNSLPRNMDLKAFDPHRKDFACKHEADVLPPIQPEAEALFQRGLVLTSYGTPKAQRNRVEAVRLWQRTIEMGHWRAGIPAAFDLMGTLHDEGLGVKGDANRAWAFWELAADMGSVRAQGYIGSHLKGGYDNPEELMWANKPVAVKMMECAIAQGDGKTAYEFGTWLSNIGINGKPDHGRALRILHDGVKWRNDECADALSSAFGNGTSLVSDIPDETRERRYTIVGRAMRCSGGDLRFPKLDKVLPLPTAQLPKWDGDEDILIDAAKAVILVGPPKPSAGGQRSGRAYIPQAVPPHATARSLAAGAAHPPTDTSRTVPTLTAPA